MCQQELLFHQLTVNKALLLLTPTVIALTKISQKNRSSAAYNEQCNSHKKLKTTHFRYPAVALSPPLYEDFCILRTNLREWNQEVGHYKNTLAHITHTKANDSSLYADVEIMQHYCTESLCIALNMFQTK